MEPITAFTVPDQTLLDACSPLPDGVRCGIWDLEGDPQGIGLDEIQAVVLPYAMHSQDVLPNVRRAPNLRMVHTQSTGYDGVRERVGDDIAIASAHGVHAAATAELAVGLALGALRGMGQAAQNQLTGTWDSKRWPGLADRRVGLLGVGGIGEEIRRRLDPFEIDLVRIGTRTRTDEHGEVHGMDELMDLAPGLEVVIAIVPLNDSTRHIIGKEFLAALPDGAVVVNVARGPVVDTEALTAEVATGRLFCALDVTDPEPLPSDHPLWRLPNALITPHVGGNTEAFPPRIAKLVRGQFATMAAGEKPKNLVHEGERLL